MAIVSTDNRFGRAMDWPKLANNSIALVTDVSAPGSNYQNASYGMSGLGTVFDDISNGNLSALPGDIITGLGTGDIGAYVIVAGLAFLVLPGLFSGSKSASRTKSRTARIKGQIAKDQALLS